MYKITYDKNTGEVLSKKLVYGEESVDWLNEDEECIYLDNNSEPKGWYVDLKTKELINKPTIETFVSKSFNIPNIKLENPEYFGELKKKDQKEIAIVRLIGIGDVIMSIPLISEIKKQFPELYINYWTSKVGARVLYSVKDLDNISVLKYQTPNTGYPPIPNDVVGYDYCINLINKFDFGAITWTRPRIDNIFLSASNQIPQLLTDKKLIPPTTYSMPRFYITKEQVDYIFDFKTANSLLLDKIVTCFLSSHGDCRKMKLDKWIEIADSMPEVKFIWTSDTHIKPKEYIPENVINTSGSLNFESFIAMLSMSDLIVCPDTSGMHLAEMLHVKCLVLEGSTNVKYHTKYYKYTDTIKKKRPLKCQPCYDWQLRSDCYKQQDYPWCLNKIKTKDIVKKIKGIIDV